MKKAIVFDMDGTLVDLYGVNDWLEKIRSYDATPYETAKPLVNMSRLARYIHKAQEQGWEVGVVSWLSKDDDPTYAKAVENAKLEWLEKHLPSVQFDGIVLAKYGEKRKRIL